MNRIRCSFCFAFLFCLLTGCRAAVEEEPISGGTIDHSDPDAPHVIKSRDIAEFHAPLWLNERWTAEDSREFEFQIVPDSSGTLIASELNSGLSLPADRELLDSLQNVIDQYDLAAMNGMHKFTAGLSPEYQEREIAVHYVSGETLRFLTNNEPDALWEEAIYDTFADWFSRHGEPSLYPLPETSPVISLSVFLKDQDRQTEYRIRTKETMRVLSKECYASETNTVLINAETECTDALCAEISALLERYHLTRKYDFSRFDHEARNYGNHDRGYYGFGPQPEGEEDSDTDVLNASILFESGKRVRISTGKQSELDGMKPMLDELAGLLDSRLPQQEG